LLGGFAIAQELQERNRGIFSFAPDDWTAQHPGYRVGKESTLHWRPISGAKPGQEGETLFEVKQRILLALDKIDRMAPSSTGMLITHGEVMVALRGLNRFLGLTDETYRQPLIPNPPPHIKALRRGRWVSIAQSDIYHDAYNVGYATHFRSIGVQPEAFDTGWVEITR